MFNRPGSIVQIETGLQVNDHSLELRKSQGKQVLRYTRKMVEEDLRYIHE